MIESLVFQRILETNKKPKAVRNVRKPVRQVLKTQGLVWRWGVRWEQSEGELRRGLGQMLQQQRKQTLRER